MIIKNNQYKMKLKMKMYVSFGIDKQQREGKIEISFR